MQTRVVLLCLAGIMALGLPGCGGGGGGGGATRDVSAITVDVNWPARSRAIGALSSALSAVVTLQNARPGGGHFVWVVNRDDIPTAHTTTYTSANPARVGAFPLTVQFRAETDGKGVLVGSASANATVGQDGRLLNRDGTPLGPVNAAGLIASVSVPPGQTLSVDHTADLLFSAYDAEGRLVAVSPGSALFKVVTGGDKLWISSTGQATAKAPGTATVTATVDGKTSPAQAVQVLSDTEVGISPGTPLINVGESISFLARVTNAPDTSVTWSVLEGTAGGTITTNGFYTAPNQPGTYHVQAVSNFDPSKQAVAIVTVQSGGLDVVIH